MKTHGKPMDFDPTLHQDQNAALGPAGPAQCPKAHIGTGFHIAFHMLLALWDLWDCWDRG